VIDERFSNGKSFLHTLDPRGKLCLAFSYSFFIALSSKLIVSGFALLLATGLVLAAGLKPGHVMKHLRVLFIFLVLLWIFLPFGIPGKAVYRVGPFQASMEGVERVASITVKSTAIVLLIVSLLATSSVFSLMHAMSHFRVPKKLLYLSFLSYRYIHVIDAEYKRLRNAMRIRGFRPKTNLHTYKSFGYLIGMLLVRSYERSERVYKAMLCRGFHGKFYLLDHFEMRRNDLIFLFIMSLVLFGMGGVEWIAAFL
jgi:cobalt/nickel transport system permease protein